MDNPTKIKVLWYSEFFCNTGFANVAHNIVKNLIKSGKYDIDVVGLHYFGEPYDHEEWPIRVFPSHMPALSHIQAYNDYLGRQRTLDLLAAGGYDIFFTLTDTFNMATFGPKIAETRKQLEKKFKWISYSPLDWEPKQEWVESGVALADFPVLYTKDGESKVKTINDKIPTRVIPHGIDLETFKVVDEQRIQTFREQFFGKENAKKFVITNINRNQPRKDIPRTIAAFKLFHDTHPDSLLYLHMEAVETGGNLLEVAKRFGLQVGKDIFFPGGFKWDFGYPVEVLNDIYNASSVIVTTTTGEGWGMALTEAMATKTPVVAPDNTSITEILDNGKRGWLIKNPNQDDYWVLHDPNDLARIVPIVSVTETAKMLDAAYQAVTGELTPQDTQKVDVAYKWVQELAWEKVCQQWLQLFDEAYDALLKDKWVSDTKVGRNDLCPCNSGLKAKKCHNK